MRGTRFVAVACAVLGGAWSLAGCGSGQSRSSSPGGVATAGGGTGTGGATGSGLGLVDVDVDGQKFKIFSYEASLEGDKAASVTGVAPATNIDYAGAKAACTAAGYRLCTLNEWLTACKGPDKLKFGFAETADGPPAVADTCDVGRTDANPGDPPSKTGAHPECKTKGLDVYDMIGNAAEWVEDGTTPVAAGEAFYQAASESHCEQTLTLALTAPTATMSPTTKSSDLGFRCCKDADASTSSSTGTESATDTDTETGSGTDTDTATDMTNDTGA